MDKKLVDRLLPTAVQVLQDEGVAENGRIPKTFRGQISSFGAAVSAGSLLAAAAFFNEQGGAKSERQKLMEAINKMMKQEKLVEHTGESLFDTIHANQSDRSVKDKVLSCAVALKLAMNLYELTKEGEKPEANEGEEASS